MKPVKLKALDSEDLTVIAALVQDAVTKPQALDYQPKAKTFSLLLNRFAWDSELTGGKRRNHERRQSVLSFAQVDAVHSLKIDRSNPNQVLSVLSVQFHRGDVPSGTIEIVFSDGPVLRLDVACIEAQLADMGPAWETRFKPRHPLS